MSGNFDSDDLFADFTADDLDHIEQAAIQATQQSQLATVPRQQRGPITRITSYQAAITPTEEDPTLDDDYGQFNVDDEDLLFDQDQLADPPLPSPLSQPVPPSSHGELLAEVTRLRAETARLKAERDKFETKAYSQDGKLDHLQRTLSRTQNEHMAALQRLTNASETEKKALKEELSERERRLARLTAELEFQKSEIREAREKRNGVSYPVIGTASVIVNGDGSPKKARVVKGSGVKSPEAKSRIGVSAARAFGKEGVASAKEKKRKREEEAQEILVPMQLDPVVSETEISRLVMEKLIQNRSLWTITDDRFEVII